MGKLRENRPLIGGYHIGDLSFKDILGPRILRISASWSPRVAIFFFFSGLASLLYHTLHIPSHYALKVTAQMTIDFTYEHVHGEKPFLLTGLSSQKLVHSNRKLSNNTAINPTEIVFID